jgi:hypothetical protein
MVLQNLAGQALFRATVIFLVAILALFREHRENKNEGPPAPPPGA